MNHNIRVIMKKHICGFLFLCISMFINGQNKDPELVGLSSIKIDNLSIELQELAYIMIH